MAENSTNFEVVQSIREVERCDGRSLHYATIYLNFSHISPSCADSSPSGLLLVPVEGSGHDFRRDEHIA
jgi:hypothetical protein